VPEAGGTMPVVMTDNRAALSHTVLTGIAVTPQWAGILDFQTRFPSALGI
jgi:hypothetical protein